MGVPIDPYTMQETLDVTFDLIDSGSFAHLIGVNADKYLQMQDDSAMGAIVRSCEIINADGASMVMAGKKLGIPIPERVSGIDLMYELCARAGRDGYTIFLLGAKCDVVTKTAEVLSDLYPNLVIKGTHDGYFEESDYAKVAGIIKNASPDIVFVGITSPKKELLIEFFRRFGLRGAFVGVGGSFDVVSGYIPRAPVWMQQIRLEWLFRMLQEPRRLAKRYVVGNVKFLLALAKEAKRTKRRQKSGRTD